MFTNGDKDVRKVLAISIAFIVLAGCDNSPEAKEKSVQRGAIELCWQDYEKKSLDDGTKRFIAKACEKMEADFKSKYGVSP